MEIPDPTEYEPVALVGCTSRTVGTRVRGILNQKGISARRVECPAVGLVIDDLAEIVRGMELQISCEASPDLDGQRMIDGARTALEEEEAIQPRNWPR